MENMPISCSHLFPQTLDFFSNSLAPLLRQGQRIAPRMEWRLVKKHKETKKPIMATATLYCSLLMG